MCVQESWERETDRQNRETEKEIEWTDFLSFSVNLKAVKYAKMV